MYIKNWGTFPPLPTPHHPPTAARDQKTRMFFGIPFDILGGSQDCLRISDEFLRMSGDLLRISVSFLIISVDFLLRGVHMSKSTVFLAAGIIFKLQ